MQGGGGEWEMGGEEERMSCVTRACLRQRFA